MDARQRLEAARRRAGACSAGAITSSTKPSALARVGVQVLGGVRAGERGALAAGGSSAASISRRLMISTACSAPITPSCAVGPGEHVVGAELLGVHRDERAAEGLAQDHRDARHGGLGERVHELRAVADHAALSWRVPGRKPGRVDEHEQRQAEALQRAHEPRRLLRGVGVEHAAEVRGWLATIPTARPSRRPNAQTTLRAQRGETSSSRPPSTSARATSRTS